MAKGRKFVVSDYVYEYKSEKLDKDGQMVLDEDGAPVLLDKKDKVAVKHLLPMMLCNASLGGEHGRPADFDFYDMYVIGETIKEAGEDGTVILTAEEYEKLKARVKQISKVFTHRFGLMVARIMEAEEVALEEKSK